MEGLALSLPYSRKKLVTITDSNQVVAIEFPSRSYLDKILLKQVGGTDTFTIDVFDKNPDDFDAATDPEEVYIVCTAISVTSGKAQFFFDIPRAFYNNDPETPTGKKRLLYFRFNDISAGNFVLVVGGIQDLT